MPFRPSRRSVLVSTGVAALALAGCSNSDPLATDQPSADATSDDSAAPTGGAITVGSAGFAENEIIAELYAQALENAGYTVERRMQIGARDIYFGALTDGSVDLLPEYSGNLLQFLEPESTESDADAIVAGLGEALPDGLRVLEAAEASNSDSYCITQRFSSAFEITSLEHLATYESTIRLAGNPELAERPYGPPGLTEIYGVPPEKIIFTPIDDGGGPLTVQALVGGEVEMANIYTTTPAIRDEDLVVLEDPKGMIVPQNVVPVASENVPAEAEEVINAVQAKLTTDQLIIMNARNQGEEKASPDVIAKEWLERMGLLG
ncbi:ABC transporter substrate-binding protein [Tessaracoccus sp. OS52]|uniref:ABC transporter substrate-binding protein n=1 Tax=Tessaracoccus sp. OS52 TaxID=2886691 RepID=UPI001D12924B|nr:ABC transporter substrate-binding protein [Tessaracoccus sp. OS52]MCC2593738.1 ABC transporter substrate-binding protein [Tessaracoccus sp. OS52]